MYWSKDTKGLFPGCNFGRVMNLHWFEEFVNIWQLSGSEDMDQQVLDFIDAPWQTKNSNMRQVGVLGFLFTKAYLAKHHFQKSPLKHCEFKIHLANSLANFKEATQRTKRLSRCTHCDGQ